MKTIKKQSQLIVGSVFGALEGTRTPDLPLRRRLLYPAELQTHSYKRPHNLMGSVRGAGDGNRTHVSSLEGWHSSR